VAGRTRTGLSIEASDNPLRLVKDKPMLRRILSIDGGGIKGVAPASFLAALEDSLGVPVSQYFDLIVGTSTGGIIALGLGLGLTARQILEFYEVHGPAIFRGDRRLLALRWLLRAKYDSSPLQSALHDVFGDRLLGESSKRLVIPSFNVGTGEVHVWKTAHHPRLERDYKCQAIEVALSTAAAPTYFPTYLSKSGVPLIDGGVWANNPVAIAAVEAIGVLEWPPAAVQILSLGCTTAPLDVNWGRSHSLGCLGWTTKLAGVFMAAQSVSAIGMVQHLLPDRNQLTRISPIVGKGRFALDGVESIRELRGVGEFAARTEIPRLRSLFFEHPVFEEFVPFRSVQKA
jgi:predicted acylesterase/phospholipase RssA